MVKVTAPAMSLDASGTLGGALVFSKWKGRNYVRERVIPANPKAAKQLSVRGMFKFLTQVWADHVTAERKATWAARADDMVVSPFNAYLSFNMTRHRHGLGPCKYEPPVSAADLGNINWTAATGGVRMVTLEIDRVAIQNGWGMLIARSTTDGFTPGYDSIIGVQNMDGPAPHDYIDTPLDADTYYYRCRLFGHGGSVAAAWLAQQTAVVT